MKCTREAICKKVRAVFRLTVVFMRSCNFFPYLLLRRALRDELLRRLLKWIEHVTSLLYSRFIVSQLGRAVPSTLIIVNEAVPDTNPLRENPYV